MSYFPYEGAASEQQVCGFAALMSRPHFLPPRVTSGSEGELSGRGVVFILSLSDVGVSVDGEVGFLHKRRGLVVILGCSCPLLLPGHFLIDRGRM